MDSFHDQKFGPIRTSCGVAYSLNRSSSTSGSFVNFLLRRKLDHGNIGVLLSIRNDEDEQKGLVEVELR
jgi:hypothetical protein